MHTTKHSRRRVLKQLAGGAGLIALSGVGASLSGCATRIGSSQSHDSSQSYIDNVIKPGNVTPVFYWTDVMLQNVRNQVVTPPPATRAFAMGHLAGFLAINGITPRYTSAMQVGYGPSNANPEVAYGVAVARAISEAFQASFFFDRAEFLSRYPDGESKDAAIRWGDYVAEQVIAARINDGAEPSKANFYLGRYPRRTDAVRWAPTGPFYSAEPGPAFGTFGRGLFPGWGAQKPWVMRSAGQFIASNFPEAHTAEFARQLLKAKAIGAGESSERTADQTQIAFFWEDGPRGVTPPGHWQILAMDIVQSMQLSLLEQARLFALLSLAQADGAICCWHNKYTHDILRPETAIRQRTPDFDNRLLHNAQDTSWRSLIPTPGFPAYTSGHSTFSAASARMIALFIDTDSIRFSGQSPDLVNWPTQLTGVRRYWSSLTQAAEEAGASREYGGIHWEADNAEGLRIGRNIADFVFQNAFQRIA